MCDSDRDQDLLMSGKNDLRQLIERMEVTIEESKAATREAHAAIKDLRQAIKEARTLINTEIKKIIEDEVAKGLAEYSDTIKNAMKDATDKVFQEFNKLERIFLGTDGSGESLESLLRRHNNQKELYDIVKEIDERT